MKDKNEAIGPLCYDAPQSRAVLLAIAEVLRKSIVPALTNEAASDVVRCIRLLVGLSQETEISEALRLALQGLAKLDTENAAEVAQREDAVLSQVEADIKLAEERITQPSVAQRDFDVEQFELFLKGQSLGGPDTRVIGVCNLSGGRSKITTLVEINDAVGLPDELIVRQDWGAGAVQGTTVVTEFHLLKHVFSNGLKVPEPLLIESSKALGAPFIVVTKALGRPQGDYFNPPRSEGYALDLAEQLAKLHQLPIAEIVSVGIPHGATTPETMAVEIARFREINSRMGLPLRSVTFAFDWLERARHLINASLTSLVHNDLGPHNMMIADDRHSVTALLDWELAGIDHPAIDLGYCREWVSQVVPWADFTGRYRSMGGREIDEFTLDFYTLWSTLRVYILILQARTGVSMGVVRDIDVVSAIEDAIPRLLRRVTKYVSKILQDHPGI